MHQIYTNGVLNPLLTAMLDALLVGLCPECECPEASPSTKWDEATKAEAVALSDGGLTFAASGGNGGARSITARTSGKWSAEFTLHFAGTANDAEVGIGVARAAWDPASGLPPQNNGAHLTADGLLSSDLAPNGRESGLTYVNGGKVRVKGDSDAGKMWFGNESGWDGDPEAGTDPSWAFTPNEPIYLAGAAYPAGSNPAGATINAGYADGSFEAF